MACCQLNLASSRSALSISACVEECCDWRSTYRATDGHVENEVELPVEWGISVCRPSPRVVKSSGVLRDHGAELATIPHVRWPRRELEEENLLLCKISIVG